MPTTPSVPAVDPAWAVALAYLPLIKRVAREFHVSRFDRDDLIQEGLIAVHRAVAKNDPARDSFGGLARRAAHNQMRDWLRWRRKAWPEPRDVAPVAARADRWDRDDLADALDAIDRLPDRTRSIIRQHFGLDRPARTGAAIAVAMGMKRDAVAMSQYRALVKVRKRLGVAP